MNVVTGRIPHAGAEAEDERDPAMFRGQMVRVHTIEDAEYVELSGGVHRSGIREKGQIDFHVVSPCCDLFDGLLEKPVTDNETSPQVERRVHSDRWPDAVREEEDTS